jgi:hypothetical protein
MCITQCTLSGKCTLRVFSLDNYQRLHLVYKTKWLTGWSHSVAPGRSQSDVRTLSSCTSAFRRNGQHQVINEWKYLVLTVNEPSDHRAPG